MFRFYSTILSFYFSDFVFSIMFTKVYHNRLHAAKRLKLCMCVYILGNFIIKCKERFVAIAAEIIAIWLG